MTTPRTAITPEQVEQLHDFMQQNDFESALKVLRQLAQHHGDLKLRDFVVETRGELNSLDRAFLDGEISPQESAREHSRVRKLLLREIREREGAATPALRVAIRAAQPVEEDDAEPPSIEVPHRRPLLRCRELTKHYARGFDLPVVDFDLHHGEIAGVVGLNGGGKSTLLRMLALDLAPTKGTVEIGDRDDRGQKLHTRVAMVQQAVPSWKGTLLAHLRQQAAFHGFDTPTSNADMVDTAVDLVGLHRHLLLPWDELSGGFRARAAIAAALVANPGVLVLDEPLAALDPRAQQKLLQQLVIRAQTAGTAIVISSQHIPEVENIANLMIAFDGRDVEIRPWNRKEVAAGRLFEIGVHGSTKAVHETLTSLEESGTITGFLLGVKSAIVHFPGKKSLTEVIGSLKGLALSHVRDITGSMIATHYADIVARTARGKARLAAPRAGASNE